MKNRYWFTILTSLVAAVFVLSLFSGIAAAQAPGENNGNLEKYTNTEKQFQDAKGQLDKALRQFNAKKDSKSKEDLVLKAKDYLGKAIDHTISYLDVLKSRAEKSENKGIIPFDVSNNIDAHVAELEQLRTKVQQDNTTEELRADNKELTDIYARIRLETRYDIAILLDNTTGKFIAKSDNVSARLAAAIQNLKSKGKDTSNLEAIAANFTNLMQEAAADQRKTEALLATHTGFDNSGMVINNTDAQAFLKQVDASQKETIKILRDASRQLQVFVRDYRILSGGPAATAQPGNQGNERNGGTAVMGAGTLTANGSGRAAIEGNVTVALSGINGTLLVSRNAVVTTDGGTNQALGNGRVRYQGFSSATITGTNIMVGISGNSISLTATGKGAAVLNGNGTYRTDNFGVSGEWKKGG
ncbi:MAG: hypothetical protein ABOK23_01515 [Candidatus Methanoperedens sp.]|nr:hypothetical protein [Candidatus Methanoperedens sp.]MCZ7394580.1 hypothetical protein [Candidatus Methanoperedens sp.]